MKHIQIEKFKKINNSKGNIYKLLTSNFCSHINGEIYISQIKHDEIKAWRMHKKYEAILLAVSGTVQINCLNNQKELIIKEKLSLKSQNLIKILPNTWYGFKGLSKSTASILVLIDGLHNESEVARMNNYKFD
tara:strand:- start:40 stop:438 length:399 start_codon:yes stop_codon:yes gene_type:complete